MAGTGWQKISVKAKQKLYDDMPPEWRLPKDKLPAEDELDVTAFPAKSGILTQRELHITDSYATGIVAGIATGHWSAEEVARAFCKRAAIAHQVVCIVPYVPPW